MTYKIGSFIAPPADCREYSHAWGSKDDKEESKRYRKIDVDRIKNDDQCIELRPEYAIHFTGLVEECVYKSFEHKIALRLFC